MPEKIKKTAKSGKRPKNKISKSKEKLLGKDLTKKVEEFLAKANQLPSETAEKYRKLLLKELSSVKKDNIKTIDKKIDEWGKHLEKEVNTFFTDQINAPLSVTFKFNIQVTEFSKVYSSRVATNRTSLPIIAKSINRLVKSAQPIPIKDRSKLQETFKSETIIALILFVNGKKEQANDKINYLIELNKATAQAEEILPKIKKLKKETKEKQEDHWEKCKLLEQKIKAINKGKTNDPVIQAKLTEEYLATQLVLLKSTEDLSSINETFVNGKPAKKGDRLYILRSFAKKDLEIKSMNFKFDPKENKINIRYSYTKIPYSKENFQKKEKEATIALLFAKRNIYVMTRDPKYKDAFEESQTKLTNKLREDANISIDDAIKIDNENQVGTTEKQSIQRTTKSVTNQIISNFNQLQRLQTENSVSALEETQNFIKTLTVCKNSVSTGIELSAIDIEKGIIVSPYFSAMPNLIKLKDTSPELYKRFLSIANTYLMQAKTLEYEIVVKDPDILALTQDLQSSISGAQGIILTIQDIAKTGEPGKPMMKSIHNTVDQFRSNDFYQNVKNPEVLKKIQSLYAINKNPEIKEVFTKLEKAINGFYKIDEICNDLKDMEGTGIGAADFFIDATKITAKIAAAVAGAIAATALFLPSGGAASGLIVTSIVASFGGTIGYATAEGAIEGNWEEAFEPKQLLTSWATGAVLMGGAMIFAKPVGMLLGKGVESSNRFLAQSRFAWLRNFGEKGLQRNPLLIQQTQGGYLKKFTTETRQEMSETGLEEIGKKWSGGNRAVGFAFMLIGCSYGTAKHISQTGNLSFENDITGHITNTGMNLEYSNPSIAKDFLTRKNAPAEIMSQFETNGQVSFTSGGITINIQSSSKPPELRILLNTSIGVNAKKNTGLEFNEATNNYEYYNNPTQLLKVLENHFLTTRLADGTIIVSDAQGKKYTINFVEKAEIIESKKAQEVKKELITKRKALEEKIENSNLPAEKKARLKKLIYELDQYPPERLAQEIKDGLEQLAIYNSTSTIIGSSLKSEPITKEILISHLKEKAKTPTKQVKRVRKLMLDKYPSIASQIFNPNKFNYSQIFNQITKILKTNPADGRILLDSLNHENSKRTSIKWVLGNITDPAIKKEFESLYKSELEYREETKVFAKETQLAQEMANIESNIDNISNPDLKTKTQRLWGLLKYPKTLTRNACEQAINLYKGIRSKLKPLGTWAHNFIKILDQKILSSSMTLGVGAGPLHIIYETIVETHRVSKSNLRIGQPVHVNRDNGNREIWYISEINQDGKYIVRPEGGGMRKEYTKTELEKEQRTFNTNEPVYIIRSDGSRELWYINGIDQNGEYIVRPKEGGMSRAYNHSKLTEMNNTSINYNDAQIIEGIIEFNHITKNQVQDIIDNDGIGAEAHLQALNRILADIETLGETAALKEIKTDLKERIHSMEILIDEKIKTDQLITELYNGNISSGIIIQGYLGHCYLLASIQALKGKPELMRKIVSKSIKKIDNNTWEVRFLGDEHNVGPIRVRRKDLSTHNKKLGLNAPLGDAILIAAYASFRSRGQYSREKGKTLIDDIVDPFDGRKKYAVEGGFGHRALKHLLGPIGTKYEFRDNGEVNFKASNYFTNNIYNPENIITASTKGAGDTNFTKIKGYKIYHQHAYTVIGFDNTSGKIYLRNPHDTSENIVLTKTEFDQVFSGLKYNKVNTLAENILTLENVQSSEIIRRSIIKHLKSKNLYDLLNSRQGDTKHLEQGIDEMIANIKTPKLRQIFIEEINIALNDQNIVFSTNPQHSNALSNLYAPGVYAPGVNAPVETNPNTDYQSSEFFRPKDLERLEGELKQIIEDWKALDEANLDTAKIKENIDKFKKSLEYIPQIFHEHKAFLSKGIKSFETKIDKELAAIELAVKQKQIDLARIKAKIATLDSRIHQLNEEAKPFQEKNDQLRDKIRILEKQVRDFRRGKTQISDSNLAKIYDDINKLKLQKKPIFKEVSRFRTEIDALIGQKRTLHDKESKLAVNKLEGAYKTKLQEEGAMLGDWISRLNKEYENMLAGKEFNNISLVNVDIKGRAMALAASAKVQSSDYDADFDRMRGWSQSDKGLVALTKNPGRDNQTSFKHLIDDSKHDEPSLFYTGQILETANDTVSKDFVSCVLVEVFSPKSNRHVAFHLAPTFSGHRFNRQGSFVDATPGFFHSHLEAFLKEEGINFADLDIKMVSGVSVATDHVQRSFERLGVKKGSIDLVQLPISNFTAYTNAKTGQILVQGNKVDFKASGKFKTSGGNKGRGFSYEINKEEVRYVIGDSKKG